MTAELAAIRVGVDWMTQLYREPLDAEVWRSIVNAGDFLEVGRFKLERKGRGGDVIHWDGDGVHAITRRDTADQTPYGLQVQVQGQLLGTSLHGLEAAYAVEQAFATRFYPGREAHKFTRSGRTDFALDVAVRGVGESGRAWVDREVFAHGNKREAVRRFSTRAKTNDAQGLEMPNMGRLLDAGQGQTLYIGTSPAQLRIYEASLKHRDNWPLHEQWRAGAWNGEDYVLRCEWQLDRDFIAKAAFKMADGSEQPAAEATWREWISVLPIVWRSMVERTRQTDRTDRRRQSLRRNSSLWDVVEMAVRDWEAVHCGEWSGEIDLRTLRREQTFARTWMRAERAIAVLHAFHPELSHATLGRQVGDGVDNDETFAERESLERAVEKVRKRLHLDTHVFRPAPGRRPDVVLARRGAREDEN
jgi:hypothetical protein